MLNVLRKALQNILDDIDAGNSNITEDEGRQIINLLNGITEQKMSKYQAMQYLNVSRATFDNLVRDGKLPEGSRQAGFKEKFWHKSDIIKYITTHK